MATGETCHGCVYSRWEPGAWLASLGALFPARPTCGNQPDSPGRMKDCPYSGACRNYRPRPPVPTGQSVRTIPLGDGLYAYVDAADFDWLNQWTWRAYGNGYAVRWQKRKLVYMHREIMKPPSGKVVDHISGNRFDNTRPNMRNITPEQNMYNMRKHAGASSIYKGVSYNKRRRRWSARIRFEGKNLHLGYFDTEIEAARAYDRKAVELFGEFARLNFPEDHPAPRPRKKAPARKTTRAVTRKPKRNGLTAEDAEARRGKKRNRR